MIYKLIFKIDSPVDKLPDSQCFFGALCHSYGFAYGKEKLESCIKEIQEERKYLFSSMYILNSLPKPMNLIVGRIDNPTIQDVSKIKKIKKIEFLETKLYIEYIKNKEEFLNTFRQRIGNDLIINDYHCLCYKDSNLSTIKKATDLRVRNNQIDRNLFYNKVTYYSNDTKVCVYVKTDNLDDIDYALNNQKYISIGSNKSIGYNIFEYLGFEKEEELDNLNSSLLISKMICSKNLDYKKSCYKLSLDNSKFNNNGETVYRDGKICFLEGSVIDNINEFGGFVVEKDLDHDNYQYLFGLLI